MIELRVIRPNGSTVRTKDGGVFLARDIVHGFVEVAGNDRAILALEVDVLAVGELELAHQGVVGVCNPGQFAVGNRVQLIRVVESGDLRDDVAGLGKRVVVDHQTAPDRANDLASGHGDPAEILRAIVIGDEIEVLPVRGKTGDGHHAIESKGYELGLAAGGGSDGKMFGGVVEEVGIHLRHVGDPLRSGKLELTGLLDRLDQHDRLRRLPHRADDLVVPRMSDEDDAVALRGEATCFGVHFLDEWTGCVDRPQGSRVGPGVDGRGDAVCSEY